MRLLVLLGVMFGLTACSTFKLDSEKFGIEVSELTKSEQEFAAQAEREYLGLTPDVTLPDRHAERNDVQLARAWYV